MFRIPRLPVLAITLLLSFPLQAAAEKPVMRLDEVIRQVLETHPDLALGGIDTRLAETDIQAAEGMLDPIVRAGAGFNEDTTPVSSTFQASKTQNGQVNAAISKPLASGGSISASAAFTSRKQGFSNPLAASFSLLNPEYRNQIDLSYRYPLLKGAGNPDYASAIESARDGLKAAKANRESIANRLALTAINLYYLLRSDRINVAIAETAVQRARRLLEYQRYRENFGLIEAPDRLQAEALLAGMQTQLAQAKSRLLTDRTRLNRLMQLPADADWSPEDSLEPIGAVPALDAALQQSLVRRPEFAALEARLSAAEARLEQARNQDRMQLDVVAQLGTRSLDGTAGGALGKSGNLNNHFASLSLEFSDTLGRNSARAALKKAELARERILAEKRQLKDQIRTDLANAISKLRAGLPALKAAEKEADMQRRKFEAEMKRYREGRSDTATIIQFESELRSAELRARLQRLDLELAVRQLQWAQGLVLEQLDASPQEHAG